MIYQEFGNKAEDYKKSNIEYNENVSYNYKIVCEDCGQTFYRQRYTKVFEIKHRCREMLWQVYSL